MRLSPRRNRQASKKDDGNDHADDHAEHLPSIPRNSHIENIKGLLEMLPNELSEEDSVDIDAEEEAKDTAPTRKSKKNVNTGNTNLNR